MNPQLPKFNEERHLAQSLQTPYAMEKYEKLALGNQIKKLRRQGKMSQKRLAEKLKTSQSALARMETGKQNFTVGILINIGLALGKKLIIKFQ